MSNMLELLSHSFLGFRVYLVYIEAVHTGAYSLVVEQRPPNPLVEVRFLVGPPYTKTDVE
jgi:hypothetical protein